MIIIVTKSGNQYVNDKAVLCVSHNRIKSEATIVHMNAKMIGMYPLGNTVTNVEQVIYASDSEKVTIKEDGNDLRDLKKKYDDLAVYNDRLRNMVFLLMNEHRDIYDKIEEKVKEKLGYGRTE